ncbi:hypothetical protein Aduo_008132 [Ancylostoma duodenale]
MAGRSSSQFGQRLCWKKTPFRHNREELNARINEEMRKLNDLVALADALKKILRQHRLQDDFKINVAKVLYDLTGLIDVSIFRVEVLLRVSVY